MQIALLHYWLTNIRGGEKVLAALGEIFPGADIFTHAFSAKLADDGNAGRWNGHRVRESFIAKLPLGRRHPQLYLPLMMNAAHSLQLENYDLIISSESGPIKRISKQSSQRHICYCHTPMRYIWDMWGDYYRSSNLIEKAAMRITTGYLRKSDLASADSVDVFVANSKFVAERIKRIYGRESIVVYPPVDTSFFSSQGNTFDLELPGYETYYLLAGELVRYKHPEIAIEACVRMNRKLVVAGTGEMLEDLQKQYGKYSNIVFLGRVDNLTLRNAYSNARALIFPGCEDFGIVPVEAQATGTPVIALRAGGALETIIENETGLFFDVPTPEDICRALEEFETRKFSPEACKSNANRFSKEVFAAGIHKVVQDCVSMPH